VFPHSPKREAADHLREALSEWCERDSTTVGATAARRAWGQRVRASGLAEFEGFLGTLDRWRAAIANYCQGRQTSGVVEGFHPRVKVLKRRGSGIFDVGRLFPRRTLALPGDPLVGQPCSQALGWSTPAIPGEP
jgi:transposase